MASQDKAPGPEDMPAAAIATPVVQLVLRHAELAPDRIALVAGAGPGAELRLSYAGLRRQVVRLADGLRKAGVARGDRVALLLDNIHGAQALVTVLALNLMGAVFVPLNARAVPRELHDALSRAGCSALVTAADQLPKIAAIRAALADLHLLVVIGGTGDDRSFEAVLESGSAEAGGWPALSPDDMSEIMFTSGTTAAPKAAVMTYGRTAASALIFREMLALAPDGALHSFFPIFTTASTRCVALPMLTAGGKAILDPAMEIPAIIERMVRERSTIYYAVPAFYIFLLEQAAARPVALPDMRLFIYGGAAMPESAIAALGRQFPQIGSMQTLGSTETGATGAMLPPAFARSKPGSVGKAYPYTEVRLVDEAMREVADGQIGEFAVRSPGTFQGYLDDPENSAATLRDGWVLMGDLGRRDAEGFLFHVDRKKDIIIRGGHNIGSMEIEGVLYRHPAVAEAAAIAVPHPKLGEDVFVFVVRSGQAEANEADLIAHCRENLADYKVPRHIAFIDTMPRNPMGKIVKTELREKARAALANA